MHCKYPFQSISIYPSGYIRPCCAYKQDLAHIDEVENIKKFFYENQHLNKLRDNELNNTPTLPGCDTCYNKSTSNSSRKKIFNSSFVLTDISKKNKLTNLDISFGNSCNSTCVMCSSQYSSKLASFEKRFNREWKPVYKNFTLDKIKIDSILNQLDELSLIEIKGGEPFANRNCLYFLDKITEISPDTKIEITTNLTIVKDQLIHILKRNKNISLIVSMDGIDKIYEWIRGITFDKIKNNLITLSQDAPMSLKRINFCVNAYNLSHIFDYDLWFNDFKTKFNLDHFFVVYDLIAKESHVTPLLTVTNCLKENLLKFSQTHLNIKTKNSLLRLYEYLDQTIDNSKLDQNKFAEWHEFIKNQRGFDILS